MERAVPKLPADDLEVAKDFYVGKLGFSVMYEATKNGKSGVMGGCRRLAFSVFSTAAT